MSVLGTLCLGVINYHYGKYLLVANAITTDADEEEGSSELEYSGKNSGIQNSTCDHILLSAGVCLQSN